MVELRPSEAAQRALLFPSVTGLLVAMLALDALLVVGHVLHVRWGAGPFSMVRWSLDQEGGFAMLFGAAKVSAAASMFWILARRTLAPVDLAWALALLAVAADDVLRIHEGFGRLLADSVELPVPSGVAEQVPAEVAVWAVMGVAVAAVLVLAHRRSPPSARARSLRISALLGLLGLFAVGFDVLNGLFDGAGASLALDVTEDGGELVTMSLIAAFTATTVVATSRVEARLHDPQPQASSALRVQ